jgi:uncharacterized membrane protein
VGSGRNQRKNRHVSNLAERDDERSSPQMSVVTALRSETHFSGPVPPPEVLSQYAQVIPDAPERILAMAEREQFHRHQSQVRVIGIADRDSKSQRIGLFGCIGIMAFLLGILYVAIPYGVGVASVVVIALIGFMVFMGVGMYRKRDGSQSFKAKADKAGVSVESKSAADKPSLPQS